MRIRRSLLALALLLLAGATAAVTLALRPGPQAGGASAGPRARGASGLLSTAQVVSALRAHGVSAHITWQSGQHPSFTGAPAGERRLLDLLATRHGPPGAKATVGGASQQLDVVVYDSVPAAAKFVAATLPGVPVYDGRTHAIIGRGFRVANVVVVARHSTVPEAVAAGRVLAAELHTR